VSSMFKNKGFAHFRVVGRRVTPALLAALLVLGWLGQPAPLVYAQRSDTWTVFLDEFENALCAIFRANLEKGVAVQRNFKVDDVTQYVFKEFGGAEGVRRFVYNMFEGALGAEEASSLADSVVADLLRNPGRRFDYRFFRGSFEVLAEAKTTGANFYHAVKEALQDAALARKPGKGQLFVWFIDPSIADEKGVKVLKLFLEENGIIVITDTESLRVLKTLDGAYRSRYGLDLIDSVADWYGIPKDAEVRAAFRQAVESGEIYNFIPGWPREKQARLDLALQGFAEDSGLAVRLRDFVKRNWDLIAQVSGVAAKLAFEECCRRNPPRDAGEAQLRRAVGTALDAYNLAIAAYGEFKTALDFVNALKAAAEGAGIDAALGAAAAGVALLQSALSWYAQWYVSTHTTWRLCREVGGRSVCFAIEKPSGFFDTERLVVTVDGRGWRRSTS